MPSASLSRPQRRQAIGCAPGARRSRFVPLVFAFLTVVLPPAARAADVTKFQVEAFGIGTLLSGSASLAENHDRTDIYSNGYGAVGGATLGIAPNLLIGFRTGLFREEKDLAPTLELVRWRRLPGYSSSGANGATSIHRQMTVIPTHAILQYRHRLTGRVHLNDEIGVGVARFTEKIDYERSGRTSLRLAGYQTNLSLLFGGALSWDLKATTLVAGVDVEMIPSRDGQVWGGGDDPQFVTLQLGIRYPRR